MAVAAPRSLLNAANSLFSASGSVSCRSRVSFSPCTSSSSSDSARSRVSCSATQVLFPPPIPLPVPQVVIEDEDVDELTFLDEYEHEQDERPSRKWITPHYLSLRLRCSSLMKKEASDALNRHFRHRLKPKPADDELPRITAKPLQPQHRQLELVNEAYERPLDFIKQVVLSDVQEKYFEP